MTSVIRIKVLSHNVLLCKLLQTRTFSNNAVLPNSVLEHIIQRSINNFKYQYWVFTLC